MKKLEFSRNISIGRYQPVDSALHRLPAIVKYVWLLLIVLGASFSKSVPVLVFLLTSSVVFALISRVSLKYLLRGFLPVLPIIIIALLIQLAVFFFSASAAAKSPALAAINAAMLATAMLLRFGIVMISIGLFSSVTTESDTARGIEDLLAPLGWLGFPSRELALAIAISFRFIPIIADELEAITKSQASRGGDFGSGKFNPVKKARAWLPLIIPVTIRALERAQLLADAMEARGYSGKSRSRYKKTVMRFYDWLWLLLAAVWLFMALWLAKFTK